MSVRKKSKLSRIKALSEEAIESEENANSLVDLQEYLQSKDIAVLKAAIRAICKVYQHLVSENYSWLVPTAVKTKLQPQFQMFPPQSSADVTEQYHDWMRANYGACQERLLQLVWHDSKEIQEFSLCSLLKLIQTEGSTHQAANHTYQFPNFFFYKVVSALLETDTDMKYLIGRFQEYLEFDDVRFYWLKNIASIVLAKADHQRCVKVSPQFVENVHHALEQVHMPITEEVIGNFFAGDPSSLTKQSREKGMRNKEEDEEEEREEGESQEMDSPPKAKRKRSEKRALSVGSLQQHRKQFSDAWLAFLRLPLSSVIYKKVLVSLHSAVMPHLLQPRRLLDFLTDSYDTGGVVSLLAVNGLFILMNQYHLDYPDFFNKLYTLLEPSLFHVKYMQRFFHLLDTFLKSTHLPLYLVAAFAKKIARLALTAPPNGVMVAVVFVTNLMKRHPNCRVLLHRKNMEGVEVASDPFDLSESDPAKCGALESCLWELKTLQFHYLPAVSTLVKRLLNPDAVASKLEEDLGKYLDIDHEQLFEEGCTLLSSMDSVPLNFTEPPALWKPEEL